MTRLGALPSNHLAATSLSKANRSKLALSALAGTIKLPRTFPLI